MRMKTFMLAIAAFLIVGPAPTAAILLRRETTAISPVTRVVELLKGLISQIEKEGKKEKDLYEDFVCWGKSVIRQKTADNKEANARIDTLEQYVADLDAGKIELTTERVDLEKEIEGLKADLELAKAQRKKENDDFEEAKAEMTDAIDALESAIKVLKDATKDHKGALLADSETVNGGLAVVAEQSRRLQKAVDLGDRFLTKADSLFLRRILTGDVPDVDWKKLNKKATFKMSYKARSGKIQDVLARLHSTFETNLEEAEDKEEEAQETYDKLFKSKSGQLDKAEEAFSKMEVENGARGMSKENALDEAKELKTNVKNDERFIRETEKSLDLKEKEWEAREELRNGELAALEKAKNILFSDDARDLFKKSFDSQVSLLQLRRSDSASSTSRVVSGAVAALQDSAKRSGDKRLLALVRLLSLGKPSFKSEKTKFEPVLKEIDKMVKLLKEEEEDDRKKKDECETGRMDDTRKAALAARDIDDKTDAIVTLEGEIKDIEAEIKSLLAQKKKVGEELDEATKIRKEQNEAWKLTAKDDKDAMDLVKSATNVIKNFYKDKGLMLAQQHGAAGAKKQPAETVAGEAPPPPPATWEKPEYGGKTGESTGIIALMEMVYEDIEKDWKTAKKEEEEAEKEYQTFKKESEDQMDDLQTEADKQDGIKGDKIQKKADTTKERGLKKEELDKVTKKIEDINPGCEFFTVNYKMRVSNRHIEIDGLLKAKAILKGGSFSEGPDPSREIKPGDA